MGAAVLDSRVKPGMVYRRPGGKNEYVVVSVYPDDVWSEQITNRSNVGSCFEKSCNRHGCGYGWFEKGEFEFIRQMGKKEFNQLMG